MRISVWSSPELMTTIKALKSFDKEQRSWIRKASRTEIRPLWESATAQNASTKLQIKVLSQTARVAVSDQNVTLSSATVGRPLSKNGAKPVSLARAAEFGADSNRRVASTSRRGKSYTRRMGSAFGSPRATGNVVYPAAAEVIPKIASIWVSTTIRSLYEALEN